MTRWKKYNKFICFWDIWHKIITFSNSISYWTFSKFKCFAYIDPKRCKWNCFNQCIGLKNWSRNMYIVTFSVSLWLSKSLENLEKQTILDTMYRSLCRDTKWPSGFLTYPKIFYVFFLFQISKKFCTCCQKMKNLEIDNFGIIE